MSCPPPVAERERNESQKSFASDHFDSDLESDQVARYTTGDTLTILTLLEPQPVSQPYPGSLIFEVPARASGAAKMGVPAQ